MSKQKKRDITQVVQNYLCHSCGSCFVACNHDSIRFENKTSGYLFPNIDYDSCTNCGLCFEVCPGDHFRQNLIEKMPVDPFVGDVISSHVGKASDEQVYLNSQSGGVTTAIVKYLLDSNYVEAAIVTTMNQNSLESQPLLIKDSSELLQAQKSKYIPTSLNIIVSELKKVEGKVAVVGLPCHIHGLDNLLKVDKKLEDKIIKIGLICDRVMLNSAVTFLSQKASGDKVTNFVFRDTSNTPYPGDITVSTQKKQHILDKKNRKLMKDYFTPARCMVCFDKMNVYSDIVLGDPHGIQNTNKEHGESLVLARTILGEDILQKVLNSDEIVLRKVLLDDVISGQGIEGKRKKYSAENYLGLEITSIYWHFLSILWIYLFCFLKYL